MVFRLIIHPDLRETLSESLPGAVLDMLSDALYGRLAVSPTKWSRRADPALFVDHQVFDCAMHHEGRRYRFRVSFRYGQDEQSLHIGGIRWTEERDAGD